MYAERKGWALDSVEVRLRHGRIHARDCEDCETKEGLLDEIATMCPVHRTLTSEIKIRTSGV